MFKLTFVVQDKNLPQVLHAVTGLVLNMEPPQPIGNAKIKGGKVVAMVPGSVKSDQVLEKVRNYHEPEITTVVLKEYIRQAGLAPTNYNGVREKLLESKIIKRKSRGLFTILKRGDNA